MTSSSSVLPPESAPAPESHRWWWIGVIVVDVVLVAIGAFLVLRGSGGSEDSGSPPVEDGQAAADAGGLFSSSDGAFTMTIPSTWSDRTSDYQTDYLNENHQVSPVDGLVTVDGLSSTSSTNYVKMWARSSTAFVAGVDVSDIGEGEVDRWRWAFDDSTTLPEETFTSTMGYSVWMGGLTGTIDGSEGEMVIATVLGGQWSASFALRLDLEHDAVRDDLRQALTTLAFSQHAAPDEPVGIFSPSSSGRTFSSQFRASIVIPATWTHVAVDADRVAFIRFTYFDSLGTWQIAEGDGTFSPTVSFIAYDWEYPIPSSEIEMRTRFPKVGGSRVDDAGVTYTTSAFGEWKAPGNDTAGWAEMQVAYPADVATGRGPLVTERRCYLMTSERREMIACVEALPGDLEAQLSAVEAALQTVRFDDEGF